MPEHYETTRLWPEGPSVRELTRRIAQELFAALGDNETKQVIFNFLGTEYKVTLDKYHRSTQVYRDSEWIANHVLNFPTDSMKA